MPKILIIDDEKSIRNSLRDILEYEKFKIDDADNGKAGLDLIRNNDYDLVLCDIKMPNMDGIEVLDRITILKPDMAVIMVSGHGTLDTAVEAIKKGAFDFIQKPLDLNRLLVSVRNAMDRTDLMTETKQLKKKISKTMNSDIIGDSKAIEEIKEMISKVAPTDARVLITGDNGTGKELVARQLFKSSARSKEAFVEVNCAAIPSELIESELFGHEKGAFTSAIKQRQGKFEQANKGTLFLDEIGDMSLSAQAKVLRALQENKITRVGGDKEIKVDVRVIAATNKDLKEEIAKGNFREDLFHRLSVILIKNPSLNDRSEDIPILLEHFNRLISKNQGITEKEFTKDAVIALQKTNWTGNVREFANVIERLIILCDSTITGKDVETYSNANA
ncbi:MAG: sigma-54-dependent Fis family transcriptional regulator [Flavobacteriales bacterium]|nr:sigma-54-dependent Fis family transcriptional regulator [Flavobacteriales bacterium]